jgi:hypothetical protein
MIIMLGRKKEKKYFTLCGFKASLLFYGVLTSAHPVSSIKWHAVIEWENGNDVF